VLLNAHNVGYCDLPTPAEMTHSST